MNFQPIANEYLNHGLCVLPAGRRKLPILKWEQYNDVMPNLDIFDVDCFGMALVCGKVSGGVEFNAAALPEAINDLNKIQQILNVKF